MREIVKGTTSYSQYVVLRSSTTGLGLTAKLFSDVTGSYTRNRAARTSVTMQTLASASAAWASGGFILVDDTNCPGLYRFDVPDAAFASGVDKVVVSVKVTGAIEEHLEFLLVNWDKQVSSIPAVTAGRTGGLPTVMAGGLAAAATATTVTLDSSLTVDQIPTGASIAIVAGTGIGQVRNILDYIGSTKVATVDGAWATNPDTTSVYNIIGPRTQPRTVFQSGTAQAGTSTTITLSSLAGSVDNFYNGLKVNTLANTGAAQTRTIIGYVGSTKVATVDHAWATNPGATTLYALVDDNGLATDGVGGLGAIGASVITATSMASNAITSAKIATNAITATQVADGTIDAATFAAGAIDAAAIAADAIGSSELAATAAQKVADALVATALSELTQAQPSATPTVGQAVMLLYHALRNERVLDSGLGFDYIKNNAGTVITKAAVTDAAGVTTRAKMVAGP